MGLNLFQIIIISVLQIRCFFIFWYSVYLLVRMRLSVVGRPEKTGYLWHIYSQEEKTMIETVMQREFLHWLVYSSSPYHVSINAGLIYPGPAYYFCGGALISTSWILTSASCALLTENPQIRLGEHNIAIIEGTEQWYV